MDKSSCCVLAIVVLSLGFLVTSCGSRTALISRDSEASAVGGTSAVGGAAVVSQVAVGIDHSCALFNGGVYCWGGNVYGQLGNNSTIDSPVPVQVDGITQGVAAIAAGGRYTCALVNGGVQCWGRNGRVADPWSASEVTDLGINSRVPIPVEGLTAGVTAIAAGGNHVCALADGAAKCWGSNIFLQLGSMSVRESDSLVPVQVQGLTQGVTAIAAGSEHTCAVVNGAAKCWGYRGSGRLGTAEIQTQLPITVDGLTQGVATVAAGWKHSCAVFHGSAYCWGDNLWGQRGDASDSPYSSYVPVQVDGLTQGVTAITTQWLHSCAVVNGTAWCWGNNGDGQLGNNSAAGSFVPIQVQGLTAGVTAIAAGVGHSCAVFRGSVFCWGHNEHGQLGGNAAGDSPVPVAVLF